MMSRQYRLRGYVKERPDGRFVGVCLRPNLVVEGHSQDEALTKLWDLIAAYMMDALKDGQIDHFMAQRAPLRFQLEYCAGWLRARTHALDHNFLAFTETRTIPQHA